VEYFIDINISKKGKNWKCPIITSFLVELADKKTTYLWHLTVKAENLEFLSNMALYFFNGSGLSKR